MLQDLVMTRHFLRGGCLPMLLLLLLMVVVLLLEHVLSKLRDTSGSRSCSR